MNGFNTTKSAVRQPRRAMLVLGGLVAATSILAGAGPASAGPFHGVGCHHRRQPDRRFLQPGRQVRGVGQERHRQGHPLQGRMAHQHVHPPRLPDPDTRWRTPAASTSGSRSSTSSVSARPFSSR